MNWNRHELLAILPQRMRTFDFGQVQELRLREGRPPRAVLRGEFRDLSGPVESQEIRYVINAASRYSPWTAASMAQGYLTAPGGHRIGICGHGAGEGLQEITSLCIRIARDITGISEGLPTGESLLILGPPGSGKTTLLRDYIRRISKTDAVSVVDERREVFPSGFFTGDNTDVLTGFEKAKGMDMVLRAMGPQVIAMDEVTCEQDCSALVRAAWCGVRLVATAHASSAADLRSRRIYRPLAESGLFSAAVVLDGHQNWHLEEVEKW
ncbi:MAG: Flp pilus assembly complex ATPase component TadA [Oscillospiraceae bacterium]|nr:Flp pilus assembly complex ATPase component TadA [Oscillospiraceae bacterium]